MTGRNIMAAVLQCKGPVVTHRVVSNVWRFLHMMTTNQFVKACEELQTLGLGQIVSVKNAPSRRQLAVFVKKQLDDASRLTLNQNSDFCTVDYYEMRYKESVSKSIPLNARSELVRMGAVAAKQLT